MIEKTAGTPSRQSEGAAPGERVDAASETFAASTRGRRIAADRRSRLGADAALLFVALIWGSTFVMVKDAVAGFPVFSFLALRFAFASLALAAVVWLRGREGRAGATAETAAAPPFRRALAPVLIGAALFAGYSFQTLGLLLTTPAKTGFITGLSVVIVPILAALILRQSPARNAWLGVGLAVSGLALLTLQPGLRIEPGDLLVLACAFAFAGHILLTGHYAPHHDPLRLTLGAIVTVTLLSAAAALIFDRPAGPAALAANVLFAAAFTGVLATSVAFGLQTAAQRFTTSTHTALIFATEPVFAGLFSFLLIGEVLGPRQALGCALILAGMVVAEMKRGA